VGGLVLVVKHKKRTRVDCSSLQLVACLYEDQPHLVDITDEVPIKHVLPSVPARDSEDMTAQAAEKMAKEDARNMTTAVTFTSNGKYILAGTSKGNINLIDTETREIIYSTNICSAIIIGVQTSQSSRVMLVNSKDRIIRTFRLPDFSELDAGSIAIELEHRFQDVVNRMSWNHTTFSATGDYVIASTFNSHELYLWERGMGSLVRMLVGRTEEMGMIDWHPYRPMFAVLNLDMGVIYIWSVTIDQKWSALAPDFVEVEENVEYHEREDEFDTYPKEDITKQRLEAEDEMIDIRPVERDAADEGFVMPVYYDIGDTDSEQELVHVKPGTMRRKGSGEEDVEDAGDDKLATAAAAGPSKKKNKNRRR
jgi:COMPASS component SWD1